MNNSKSPLGRIFYVAILLKGIYSAFEVLAGAALLFVSSQSLWNLASVAFRYETSERPRDIVIHQSLRRPQEDYSGQTRMANFP